MTRFAKIAAETVYDPETDDEPREKVPSWKRALPWIAGGLGAAGLGYAAYKGFGPKPEKQGPGVGTLFGAPLAMTSQTMGGAVNTGLVGGTATAGATAAVDALARKHYNSQGQKLSDILAQGNVPVKDEGKIKSFMRDTLMVGKEPHDQAALHSFVGGAKPEQLLVPPSDVPASISTGTGPVPLVKQIHNIPQGGTDKPLEALRMAYGDKHIDQAIKDFDEYSRTGTTTPEIQKAEALMGGRRFDPAAMHSQLGQIKTHAMPLGGHPVATGMSRAVRRGGAVGLLTALLTGGSNLLVQSEK